eukprot:gene1861-16357_t
MVLLLVLVSKFDLARFQMSTNVLLHIDCAAAMTNRTIHHALRLVAIHWEVIVVLARLAINYFIMGDVSMSTSAWQTTGSVLILAPTILEHIDAPVTADTSSTATQDHVQCRSGYTLDPNGRTCSDIDECGLHYHGCQHNCNNFRGGFYCSCRSGYRLNNDNRTCSGEYTSLENINECTEYHLSRGGLNSTISGCTQNCHNVIGTFRCSCNPGYKLASDGKTCYDVDECLEGSHRCHQKCLNTVGSYDCQCLQGYKENADGYSCQGTSHPHFFDSEDGAGRTWLLCALRNTLFTANSLIFQMATDIETVMEATEILRSTSKGRHMDSIASFCLSKHGWDKTKTVAILDQAVNEGKLYTTMSHNKVSYRIKDQENIDTENEYFNPTSERDSEWPKSKGYVNVGDFKRIQAELEEFKRFSHGEILLLKAQTANRPNIDPSGKMSSRPHYLFGAAAV